MRTGTRRTYPALAGAASVDSAVIVAALIALHIPLNAILRQQPLATALTVGCAMVAVIAAWQRDLPSPSEDGDFLARAWFLGLLALVLYQAMFLFASTELVIAVVLAVGGLLWPRYRSLFAAALAAFVGTTLLGPVRIDVLDLHIDAGRRLAEGMTPYGVTAFDTAPGMHGETIVGYPYPAVAMLAFGGAAALGADPRVVSIISVAVTTALMARARRPRHMALVLVFVTAPTTPHVIRQAWTEPLMLALIALATVAVLPRSHAIRSGLAVASKQYMLLIAPWIFFSLKDKARWVFGFIVGLGYTAGLLFGAREYITGAWTNLAALPPRDDSYSLIGVRIAEIDPLMATFVSLAGPLAVGYALWRRNRTVSVADIAAVLSVFFVLSKQSFANYWWLIAGLLVLSRITETSPRGDRTADEP